MSRALGIRRLRAGVLVSLIVLVAGLVLVLGSSRTAAHPIGEYYTRYFDDYLDLGLLHFYFDDDFPSRASTRDRILKGAATWKRRNGAPFFSGHPDTDEDIRSKRGGTPEEVDRDACALPVRRGRPASVVYWEYIDGPGAALGLTRVCTHNQGYYQGTPAGFIMFFDKTENWYRGVKHYDDSRPDLWGVATHEFGHATGFGKDYQDKDRHHFSRKRPYCKSRQADGSLNTKNYETMCPDDPIRSWWQRDLAEHDRHTFRDAYP